MSHIIEIQGRKYDLSEIPDVAAVQEILVPPNWPGTKADCVKLFQKTSDMLVHQLRRHLGANWQTFCKLAQERRAENDAPTFDFSFKAEVDQSAISVVAITKHSMSYSKPYKTEGKAVTLDMNQGDFYEKIAEGEIFDPSTLTTDGEGPAMPPDEATGEAPDTSKGDPNHQEPGAEAPKPKKRGRPKKNTGKEAAAGD